ncbi:MAG: cytochrome c [Pseudomonadota bacterium]
MRYLKLTLFLAILSGAAALAGGHNDANSAAVKARKAHMGLYGYNLGPMAGMMRGNVPYDAEVAGAAAKNLAALAAMDQSRYWLEGTDTEAIEGTRALPAIWSDAVGYEAANAKLAEAAAALAEAAGNGEEAFKAAFGPVGQSCGGCHEDYRQPR